MRHYDFARVPRGIAFPPRANADQIALIRQIQASVAEMRDGHSGRLETIEASIESLLARDAVARLGGGGGAPFSGLTAEIAAAFIGQLQGAVPSATMRTNSDPDGGYTVPTQVDKVIGALVRNLSPLRRLATQVPLPVGFGSWSKIVTRVGSAAKWSGETETREDTEAVKLGMVEITPHEIYAVPELTNHVLDDSSFNLQAFLSDDVAAEFALEEGSAFVIGDGIKKPMGFLGREPLAAGDAARDFGRIQYKATGAAATLGANTSAILDNLIDLITLLRIPYRREGATWLMNSTTAALLQKLKDADGRLIWVPALSDGQSDRLLGYPVEIEEGMPDIGADACPIAFGNIKRGYAIVDKVGVNLIVDRVTKKGFTKLYFAKRVGGGVLDSNAIKVLKCATE